MNDTKPALPDISQALFLDRPLWKAIAEWEGARPGAAAGVIADRIDAEVRQIVADAVSEATAAAQARIAELNALLTDARDMLKILAKRYTLTILDNDSTREVISDLNAALASTSGAEPASATRHVTDGMVTRFLGWPLPKDFCPDCGISFDGRKDDEWNKNKTWPTGTNLLTAIQARQMLEYVFGGAQP